MATVSAEAKPAATPEKGEDAAKIPKSGISGPRSKYHSDGLELLTNGPNNNFPRVRESYDTAFGKWGQNGKWNASNKADRVLMKAPTGFVTASEVAELSLNSDELVAAYRINKMKNIPQQRLKILNTDRREQIQFILDHCEPDLQVVLKLSETYKTETLVDNGKPNPISVWDYC